MKKRILLAIIVVILIGILSGIIPVKKEEKEVWHVQDLISYGQRKNFYYNIYGKKIWPYLSEYDRVVE